MHLIASIGISLSLKKKKKQRNGLARVRLICVQKFKLQTKRSQHLLCITRSQGAKERPLFLYLNWLDIYNVYILKYYNTNLLKMEKQYTGFCCIHLGKYTSLTIPTVNSLFQTIQTKYNNLSPKTKYINPISFNNVPYNPSILSIPLSPYHKLRSLNFRALKVWPHW